MPRYEDADWLTENDTRDLAYMARHILKTDWVTPTPRPVPTALETDKCPPHIFAIGKLGEPILCRKCHVEKVTGATFRGYEPAPNRDRQRPVPPRLKQDDDYLPLGMKSRQR